ncbi:MAG: molybdopterin-dependent oxidoreductase [Acidilobaceae archaeon]
MKLKRRDFIKAAGLTALTISLPASKVIVDSIRREEAKGASLAPEVRWVKTYCGMCGALCGIEVLVNYGRPAGVRPILGHPQPGLCGRSSSLKWLWDSPLRLKKPMKRVGERGEARFVEVDWDTALNEIASKLRSIVEKYGYKAIAITHHDVWSYYMPLFSYLLGTPNVISHVSMCHASGTVARGHVLGAGGPPTIDPDYENASYLLLIGRTLSTASMGVVNRATSNEKLRIVVVDPRMPEVGFGNVEWVPIIPGTDAAFVLSLIHVIIEEGLYDAEFLKRYTNAPFLIKPDESPLTEADIIEGGDTRKYLVWDLKVNGLVDHKAAADPDLLYTGKVKLKDDREIDVKTAFILLKERASKYKPEEAEKITGVDARTIRRIAREFALYRGVADDTWYISKNGNDYDDVRAILILNTLIGNIDKPGGLCYRESARFPSIITVRTIEGKRYAETVYDARMPEELFGDVGAPRVDRVKYRLTPATFDAILDAIIKEDPYPIKALFVIGTSPIMRDMNTSKVIEAYKKLDLLVVIDILPQEDVDYADYVLPDTIFLERDEITSTKWTLHASVQVQNRVIDPPEGYDVRDALWVMFEIVRRAFPERAVALGWSSEYANYKKYEEEFLHKLNEGIISRLVATWKLDKEAFTRELNEKGYYILKRKEYYVRPYKTALGTPSGKIEIYSLTALANKLDPLPDYSPPPAYTLPKAPNEFYLVNGKGPLTSVHASLMEPMKYVGDRSIWMNPRDAERLGIRDGDLIELEGIDTRAKAVARVKVTNRVREGVLFVYSQMWGRRSKLLPQNHFAREGINPHWFSKDYVVPIVGGGASNSSVRVRKL